MTRGSLVFSVGSGTSGVRFGTMPPSASVAARAAVGKVSFGGDAVEDCRALCDG